MATETPPDFATVLAALELDPKTLSQPVDATFIPSRDGRRDPSLDSLPVLALDDGHGSTPELALDHVLGEGGRGEIRLGRQLSLRRQVAVKSLKGEAGPSQTLELLREARITGNLEHPNVVPVYALGRDARDRVLLVMKQVKGEPWGKLIRAERCPRTDAQLERHLDVFRQVCNAVEFAHSQGIVHRDLKPDNIMVGAFGEVVVLDWGLAISLEGDPARGLPPASEFRGLAGTPAYMAPELVSGEGSRVGRWTDVYLLGAILHELVVGTPPHRGESVPEVLERAYASAPPQYPEVVPPELAEICRRAMAAEPARRFPSVAELRVAVQDFWRHRQSAQLAAEAQARLAAVPAFDGAIPAELAAPAHAALAQSRFGFEQALRTWPENPLARSGLRATIERQVELELVTRNLAGAERALRELPGPNARLAEQVERLRAALAEEQAELERLRALQRDIDVDASERVRNILLIACGVFWCVVPVGLGFFERVRHFEVGQTALGVAWLIFAASTGLAIWLVKGELLSNRMGRMIAAAIAVIVLAAGMVRLATALMGRPFHEGFGYEMIVYATAGGFASTFVDVRFVLAAVVYAIAGPLAAWKPEWAYFIAGPANAIALIPTALFWKRLQRFQCEEPIFAIQAPSASAQPATRRAQSA